MAALASGHPVAGSAVAGNPVAARLIRVFLVDDSPLALVMLRRMLASSSEIEVVGTARSGREALAALEAAPEAARPDVICTDYQMPEMDGLELIGQLMTRFPRPILVISSLIDPAKRDQVFPLLSAGAVDVWAKPDAGSAPDQAAALVQKIKLLSGVVVIARRAPTAPSPAETAAPAESSQRRSPAPAPLSAANPLCEAPANSAPRPNLAPEAELNPVPERPPSERESKEASRQSSSPGETLSPHELPPRESPLPRETSSARESPLPRSATGPQSSPAPQTFEAARLALQNAPGSKPAPRSALRAAPLRAYQAHPIRIVAIGASTGGPQILHAIFAALPPLGCPILCVQHISSGFLQGLVDWLDGAGRARVKIAADGELATRGTVYFPPEGAHLEIDARGRLSHLMAPPVGGHRPAINVTFESVARGFGPNSVGVLLTGMGCDGAQGLETLMLAGSATIAQDEASSVVFGMPKQAIARGAAHWVLPGDQIAAKIVRLVAG